MARLRQQHPQNYVNSGNIHTDFENVIRYINAAELGDKTVGELLAVLFNEEGVFRGPVQMRVDADNGLQFRVGMYSSEDIGWQNLVDIASLRGPSGSNAGVIEGPFFYSRQDIQITTGITSISVDSSGTLYTTAPTVTFSAPDDDSGSTPTATTTLDGDGVVSVTITDAGSGYINPPTVTIAAPENSQGTQATATCTLAALPSNANEISYNFDADTDDVVVYKNGILLSELTTANTSEYTIDSVNDKITIDSSLGVALADKISIYSVRSQSVTNFRRRDIEIVTATSSVPFVHSAEERILVWRNGILQEEGGAADFLASAQSNTITFLDPQGLAVGDKITVMTVENQALKTVGGLMFEDEYADENGFLRFDKISISDNQIAQAKVSDLASSLGRKANILSQSSSPVGPATGDLWLDTSLVPAILKFYDGTQWLETSPESSLPTFVQTNASQYVRVNGTGTALEYGDIDFSSLVPKTYMGAANGVATLDTAGSLPVSQLPETFSTVSIPFFSVWEDSSDNIGNKTYFVTRMFKQTIRIDGIAYKLNSGSCTIQLSVDGTPVGGTYSVTTTEQSENLSTVIEIDSTSASKRLEIIVTNASSGKSLEVAIAAATVNV
jgi:hypothetical protein